MSDNFVGEKPVSQEELVDQKIKESGIAQRMLDTLKRTRGTQDPEINFGINNCKFSVKREIDPYEERVGIQTQVIIEMPDLRNPGERVTQAFGVREGKSFGTASEDPLTQEQMDVVNEVAL